MNCPKCNTALNKVTIKIRPEYGSDVLSDAEKTREIEVDQCLSCNGVWFDKNELEQYMDEKLLILNSPAPDKYKAYDKKLGICPKCNKEMTRRPAPKDKTVTIDTCEKCGGVWLDGSELDKLESGNLTFKEKSGLVLKYFKRLFKGGE